MSSHRIESSRPVRFVNTKWRRVRRKWPELRHQALPWLAAFLGNIVITGWVYSLVEGVGPIAGPWWGLVTGSTTGYGDLYPHSTAGRGIAGYLIVSSIVLDRIFSAQLTKVMIEEPNLYSDAEQERDEAASVLTLALVVKMAGEANIDVYGLPEFNLWRQAVRRVEDEEKAREEASND
jgi:hypothetical protein